MALSGQDIADRVADVRADGRCGAYAFLFSLRDYLINNPAAEKLFSNKSASTNAHLRKIYDLYGLKKTHRIIKFEDLKKQLEQLSYKEVESRAIRIYRESNRYFVLTLKKLKNQKIGNAEVKAIQQQFIAALGLEQNTSREKVIAAVENAIKGSNRFLDQASLMHIANDHGMNLQIIERKNLSKFNKKPPKKNSFYILHDSSREHFQAIAQTPASTQTLRKEIKKNYPNYKPSYLSRKKDPQDFLNDFTKHLPKNSTIGRVISFIFPLIKLFSKLMKGLKGALGGKKQGKEAERMPHVHMKALPKDKKEIEDDGAEHKQKKEGRQRKKGGRYQSFLRKDRKNRKKGKAKNKGYGKKKQKKRKKRGSSGV